MHLVKGQRKDDVAHQHLEAFHPRKGEIGWKPLAHQVVLRILHHARYAGAFTFRRHRDIKLPDGNWPTPRCPAVDPPS